MKRSFFRLLPLLAAVGASIGLLVAVLWERSPVLAVALLGPLAALVLYKRATARGRAAMRLALVDPLTGLGNQRRFHRRLDEEVARADAERGTVTLLLFDVDDFKRINDRHGHASGDRVLEEVAERLRRDGEAFRLGGDEFALILPEFPDENAAHGGEAVVAHSAGVHVEAIGVVSLSTGAATFPREGRSRQELIEIADERLYRSKRKRRGSVEPPSDSVAAGS